MSKIIYVCSRNRPFDSKDELRLSEICKELEPDNLSLSGNHKISVHDKIAFGIMNPPKSIVCNGTSVLLGYLYNSCNRLYEPLSEFPDGSYALFRDNPDYLEVVSDPAASRTIWYYFDDNLFISSTSQRAIVKFIGNFVFDERVIPWMLSTGSLGPGLSWDKRLQRLDPDSSVVLDKDNWSISTKQTPVKFAETSRSDSEHQRLLTDAIKKTVGSLKDINYNEWVLPLSGGYDSRAILCFIMSNGINAKELQTITWGLKDSINEKGNDARVAKDLAGALGVKHRYYHTNISEEPIEKVIDRFILCGEGRIDHLSGYMDGFEIWRKLHEDGVQGIIRGDEGFGWGPVLSKSNVLQSVGCNPCSNIPNLKNIIVDYGFSVQELPLDLEMRETESLEQWRDRLYHEFRLPTILAALSDLKYSYVEQIDPLISRSILHQVREMPDSLRTDKALFKSIVNAIGPNIAYANKGANLDPGDIMRKNEVVNLLKQKIQSEHAREIFRSDFIQFILDGIKTSSVNQSSKRSLEQKIIRMIPPFIKDIVRKTYSSDLDGNILAFRVFIIIRMHEILKNDCKT